MRFFTVQATGLGKKTAQILHGQCIFVIIIL